MGTYVNVFGGDVIQTSEDTYLSLSLGADTALVWPLENAPSTTILADLIDITPNSSGFTVSLPDATQGGLGIATVINNLSASYSFNVADAVGGVVCTVSPGTVWLIYLSDNAKTAGKWRTFQYGAQAGSINLAAISGNGLTVISNSINQSMPVSTKSSNYVMDVTDRASVVMWVGSSGTFTLPSAAVAGNNWFAHVRNSGSGDLSLAPPSGTIDGSASKTFPATGASAIVFCDGVNYYTIGFGATGGSGGFDYVTIDVTGNGNLTLTGSQLHRIGYKFYGVLNGDRNIIVPATIEEYWVNNATTSTGGSWALTVKTASGTSVVVPQGTQSILYCDGSGVVVGSSQASFPLSIGNGGTGANNAGTARANLGSSTVGDALYTAVSASAALTTLGATTIGSGVFTSATALVARTLLGAAGLVDANVFTTTNTFRPSSGPSAVFDTQQAAGAYVTFQRLGIAKADIGNSQALLGGTLDYLAFNTRSSTYGMDFGIGGTRAGGINPSNYALEWLSSVNASDLHTGYGPTGSVGFAAGFSHSLSFGAGQFSFTDPLQISGGLAISGNITGANTVNAVSVAATGTISTSSSISGNSLSVSTSIVGSTVSDAGGQLARLASPAFTGTPTGTTAAQGTNTTQLATTQYVMAGPGASLATSGYTRLYGGLTLQWGTTGSVGAISFATITFPTAFSSTAYCVTITCKSGIGSAQSHDYADTLTASNFRCHNDSDTSSTFFWMAIGPT